MEAGNKLPQSKIGQEYCLISSALLRRFCCRFVPEI
jgi:hypothetical protein